MIARGVREFLEEDKAYFEASRVEITAQNNRMLVEGCLAYGGVLLFYTVFTLLTEQPTLLRRMYFIFDAIHAILCLVVFTRPRRQLRDYRVTQVYCILLEVTVLGFFALEGAFTSRTEHSLYIPIALLLVLLLFTHSVLYTNLLIPLYLGSYTAFSWLYKTPEAARRDLDIALATFLAANIGYVMIAQMRHRASAALSCYESVSSADPLTGLLNQETIQIRCKQAAAHPDAPCAFLLLDLDDFKSVNDRYGAAAGDDVLRNVAWVLRQNFRGSDSIGRFAGDRFIILMNGCGEREAVLGRVRTVLEQVAALEFPQPGLRIRCSVGITAKRPEDDPNTMRKRAEEALYQAKMSGKGKYGIG